jgi:hypothetical protein
MDLDDLDFVSTGICPGCEECARDLDLTMDELREAWEDGLVDESSFSWSPCEACGSTLGGNRYVTHGRDGDAALVHLEICYDCFAEINGLDEEGE